MAAPEGSFRVGDTQLTQLESELAKLRAKSQETSVRETGGVFGIGKTKRKLPTLAAGAAGREASELVKNINKLKKRLSSVFGENTTGVRQQTGGSALTSTGNLSELSSISELV